ncbi:MAG: 16S rRNA (guanine(527)-N(7))-methyltransferase RsmG, partial [Firmicutes bacterium]|nr:16S rRNA (guanine(527)-N(7))-methyltransferase RsmG [Bacillota bacterium]
MNKVTELKTFNNYLIEQNKLFNLTAIKDEKKSWYLNIADSLLFLSLIPKNAKVCDVGSGCGCPAIPIAIEREDIKMTMLDSVNKKVEFLNKSCSLLGLRHTKAIHSRIEDHTIQVRKQNSYYDIITARAVAPLATLLEYCIPLLKVGGKLLAFKGANYQEEIDAAKNAFNLLNCKLEKVEKAQLATEEETLTRYCLIITK